MAAQQAPSVELATLGIGKESTYGTAVSPSVFLIPSSWSMDGDNNLIARPGARRRISQSRQLTGMFTGKGTFSVEADPDTLGALLLAAWGSETYPADTGNPGSAPTISTTIATGTSVGQGLQPCTPTAMTNIAPGVALVVDSSGNQETVIVKAVTATTFYAVFTKTHAAGATIAAGSLILAYDHTYTIASPRPSFTAQLNDVILAKNAFGCKISQLSFKVNPKAVLEAQCQVEYQGELQNGSPTSPTFSILDGFLFETAGNAIEMNGIVLDQACQGITLELNAGLVTDYPKFGNGRYRGQLPEGQTKCSMSLDLAFEDETALNQFWGYPGATGPASIVLPAPLSVAIVSADYVNAGVQYALKATIPEGTVATAPIARKAGDYLKQTVTFQLGESLNAAGDDIKLVLVNANSGASF